MLRQRHAEESFARRCRVIKASLTLSHSTSISPPCCHCELTSLRILSPHTTHVHVPRYGDLPIDLGAQSSGLWDQINVQSSSPPAATTWWNPSHTVKASTPSQVSAHVLCHNTPIPIIHQIEYDQPSTLGHSKDRLQEFMHADCSITAPHMQMHDLAYAPAFPQPRYAPSPGASERPFQKQRSR